MTKLLEATLEHLHALVRFDTRNPPRMIGTDGLFDYLRMHLPNFDLTLTDHGAGAISLLALRGSPRILFNVHLDTVPAADGWSANPFDLRVVADRAIGLGACDIKGAAAALLAAAALTAGDAAFLFSTDEEADDPRCVAHFLGGSARRFDAALIAEPTCGRAVIAHRGYSAVRMRFTGRAGHASDSDALGASAVHQAVRWSVKALDHVASHADRRCENLRGLRFNIGRIDGGIGTNVVAPAAELHFNLRPLPFDDPNEVLDALIRLADPAPALVEETFRGTPLPGAAAQHDATRSLAASLRLPVGNAVDFWSEAALFAAAGVPAIVYGPGNIAQAHAADEWVALDDLARYARSVHRIIDRGYA